MRKEGNQHALRVHSESNQPQSERNQHALREHSESNQPQSERSQHALRGHSAPIDHSEVEGEDGAEFE